MNVFLAILGIGFLIFVHELGHFLAAKKVGIRVDTFALGFQPTIFGWKARLLAIQRGETEYVIGLLPFGGYVKMAGEELEDEKTGASDEYASKTPSQRAFVLVAGAAMNLIFGFLLFLLAFSLGVSFVGTRVGAVSPGSPAWEAGILPGDRIKEINGKEKREFTDVRTSIALSRKDRDLTLGLERPGPNGPTEETVTLRPVLDRVNGILTIGILPGIDKTLGAVIPDSPADQAGMRKGDTIEQVTLTWGNGRNAPLPRDWMPRQISNALRDFANGAPEGAAAEFQVTSAEGESRLVRVPISVRTAEKGDRKLQIHRAIPRIEAVQPKSPLAGILQPGAEILSIDGTPARSLDLLTVLELTDPTETRIRLGLATGEQLTLDRDTLLSALSTQGVRLTDAAPAVSELQAGGLAETLGLQDGDIVLSIAGEPAQTLPDDHEIEPGTELVWRRGTEVMRATTASTLKSTFGAKLHSRARIGRVIPGGPADEAGMLGGDRIIAVNGSSVPDWESFIAVFEEASRGEKDGSVQLRIERDGAEQDLTATPRAIETSLGLNWSLEEIEIRTSLGGAVSEGWNQTIVWGRRIFMMIGALARRDVAAKNLAGPVGIVHIGKRFAEQGITQLLFVLAMISINLGVFNLLPFPILDGGHLLFLLIEKIKGSPVSEQIQGWVHFVAFLMLIGLALFVTYHDLLRLVQ